MRKQKIKVNCNWCGQGRTILPCHYKQNTNKIFYCSISHQLQFRNKYNNPSKREDVKRKIGYASKKRNAIWIARNSENFKNRTFLKGSAHPLWKEDISYKGLHQWLSKTFGKANKCENKECKNESNYYDWALVKGKKYERNRKNFMRLCRSCHNTYDGRINNIKHMRQYGYIS